MKYNEFGEVISVNGLTTGQHLGTPMQDALGTDKENSQYYVEKVTQSTNNKMVEDEQPNASFVTREEFKTIEELIQNLPSGGGSGKWELVDNVTLEEDGNYLSWTVEKTRGVVIFVTPHETAPHITGYQVFLNGKSGINGKYQFNYNSRLLIRPFGSYYFSHLNYTENNGTLSVYNSGFSTLASEEDITEIKLVCGKSFCAGDRIQIWREM